MSEFEEVQIEKDDYEFTDEEKTQNIHNEVENYIAIEDSNGLTSNEIIQEVKSLNIHDEVENDVNENPKEFTSIQSIQNNSNVNLEGK